MNRNSPSSSLEGLKAVILKLCTPAFFTLLAVYSTTTFAENCQNIKDLTLVKVQRFHGSGGGNYVLCSYNNPERKIIETRVGAGSDPAESTSRFFYAIKIQKENEWADEHIPQVCDSLQKSPYTHAYSCQPGDMALCTKCNEWLSNPTPKSCDPSTWKCAFETTKEYLGEKPDYSRR